jgi:NAD(P)-dependent dehydrogenase (short-subunit alcohol dehydrogenase family)
MDILITGCSRGIGLELVKLMSAQGHRVLAVSRNIQALENISSLVTPLSLDDFDAMFHVNMKGPFLLLQALADRLRKGAHVVNIGSMGGYQGSAKFAGLSLYSASKAALAVFSECLAEEWKEKGVKVNCLALGAAQTEMLEAAFPGYNAPVSAAEMASFIADFSLNGHRFFNGKVLPVSVSTP